MKLFSRRRRNNSSHRRLQLGLEILEVRNLLAVAFLPAVNYDTPDPYFMAVGDYNGDANTDLAVANPGTNNVSILLGDGTGAFGAATNFAAGAGPQSVAAGDFDDDGDLDIVTANPPGFPNPGTVSILLNNGSGAFAAASPASYAVGLTPIWVEVADFNGDGQPDLAVANVADENGPNDVSILLGNGGGTFQSAVHYAAGQTTQSATPGDFNNDGKIDLAVVDSKQAVYILLGDGDGTFQTGVRYGVGGSTPLHVAVGDFDGDGDTDLAVPDRYGDKVSVLLGNGDGTFQSFIDYFAGSESISAAVGDFNADGKRDLAVASHANNDVAILLGNGDGSFEPPVNFPVGTGPVSVRVGDFNADGLPDLATANFYTDDVSILLNNSMPTSNQPPTAEAGGPYSVPEGGSVVIDGSGSSDPNQTSASLVYAWDLDGDNVFGEIGAAATRGNETGINPTFSAAGLDGPSSFTVILRVIDSGTLTSTDTATITINNVAPMAADDAVTFQENALAQVLNLLANDSDPAGANDPLSVTSVNTTGTTGAVTLNAGVVKYSPDGFFEALGAGEMTLDSFEYSISDGDGGTDTATVTVTVTGQNDAPTATGTLADVSVNQNAANSVISLTGLFQDVDANDTLTITAVSSSTGLVTAGVSGSSLTLDYQANQSGTATITVTAKDGSGASVSLTFNAAVVSPAQQGNAIILLIQQWKADGKINAGVANSMIVKVVNSLKSYDNGNIIAAGNQLNALKNEISAKVKPGSLTLADATLANSLIDALYDSMTS